MFRQGQLAVHGLAILLGRNEAGISNRGKKFLHHAVVPSGVHWSMSHDLTIAQLYSDCLTGRQMSTIGLVVVKKYLSVTFMFHS